MRRRVHPVYIEDREVEVVEKENGCKVWRVTRNQYLLE